MPDSRLNRNLIYIISRFSDWKAPAINRAFHNSQVYANKHGWLRFLEIFLGVLGAGLFVSGVFFFFAYNWQDMKPAHKFILLQGLIIVACIPVFFAKPKPLLKKILISVAALLVGALWAVYGQVYQTGADTYDYFLVWIACIALWLVASAFPPLWLVGLLVLNLTVHFYFIQDGRGWSPIARANILFIFNAFVCILTIWLADRKIIDLLPSWFTNAVMVLSVYFLSQAIIIGIFDQQDYHLFISIILLLMFFPLCIAWGFRQRSIFPIAIVGLAAICMLTALFLKPFSDSAGLILFIGLFFLGSTTGLIIKLVQLNKKWNLEN